MATRGRRKTSAHALKARPLKFILALVLMATGAILVWQQRPRISLFLVERELNEIYRDHRPFPYRWASAPYSALKGAHPEQLAHRFGVLTRRINEIEEASGKTPKTQQARGRLDLLSGDYDGAVLKYQLAFQLAPGSPAMQLELGIAFAMRAKAEERPLDYEFALEQMLESLQGSPSAEGLFDSALLCSEAQIRLQSVEFWKADIEMERPGPWRNEAEERWKNLVETLRKRERHIHDLTASPASYLEHAQEAQDSIEMVLGEALANWLPAVDHSALARQALERLAAELEERHHDPWLKELIQEARLKPAAVRSLSKAWEANTQGNHLRAAAYAEEAMMAFGESNPAGELRSRLEETYALNRSWKYKECFQALYKRKMADQGGVLANPSYLRKAAASRHYVWIEQQSWLEEISCASQSQKMDVIRARQEAFAVIEKGHYESLRLRVLSFLTEKYGGLDSRVENWGSAQKGLRSFWERMLPANRGYTLCYTLSASAHEAGNMQAEGVLLHEAVSILQDFPYRQLYALSLSDLGAWQASQGLRKEADQTFQAMDALFSQLDASETLKFRRQAEIRHAEAELAEGDGPGALSRLQTLTHGLDFPYRDFGPTERRHLLPAFGNACLAAHDYACAKKHYESIVLENIQDIKTIHDRTQRESSLKEIESAWRGLAYISLQEKDARTALNTWESLRGGRLQAPDSPLALPPSGVTLLVYAFLPDGLYGWLVKNEGVKYHKLDGPSARKDSAQFAALAADRESPMEAVQSVAKRLYANLLGPFSANLPRQGLLIIDADRELSGITWPALESPGGEVLIERFAISQALGWAEVSSQMEHAQVDTSRSLILADPALSPELSQRYPRLIEARRAAESLRGKLKNTIYLTHDQASVQAALDHLPHVSLFHSATHGISYGGFGALLLAPGSGPLNSSGILQAGRIRGMDLSSLDLVVLASCSSGVGEQTGVVNVDSLVRSFLDAGAKRVIAARWNVNSPATARMMSEFYEMLIQQRQRPAVALRSAVLAVRRQPRYAHPYYWAGFQVFGVP